MAYTEKALVISTSITPSPNGMVAGVVQPGMNPSPQPATTGYVALQFIADGQTVSRPVPIEVLSSYVVNTEIEVSF